MTVRRPEVDTRWASSLELKTFWSGFWAFFRRAPTGLGTSIFRAFAIILIPLPLLLSAFLLISAANSTAPGSTGPRVLLALVFGVLMSILGTWGMAKLSLVPAFFTLVAKSIEGPSPEEEDRARMLAEHRSRRLAEIESEKERDSRIGEPNSPSEPKPQAWTRPEPPPGSTLGPRRIDPDKPAS